MEKLCVLVLGAGASRPYGLPLGRELRNSILRMRAEAEQTSQALQEVGISHEEFQEFQHDFQRSGFTSIDAFLEVRNRWLKTGKLAIAYCLSELESTSKLFPPTAPIDHWFEALWHKLKRPTWGECKKTNIRVVTFNYDRCLEIYLSTVISNNYGVAFETVWEWLKKKIVIHVHGTLGDYTRMLYYWKNPKKAVIAISGLRNSIKSIVIVSEGNPRTRAFLAAKSCLAQAGSIAFIGFGFHRANIERLAINFGDDWRNRPRLTATHKGLTPLTWGQIQRNYFGFHVTDKTHKARTIGQLIQEFIPMVEV
jgi:hypothetical protein